MSNIPFRPLRGIHSGVPEQLLFDLEQNFEMVARTVPQERQICDTTDASLIFQLPHGHTTVLDYLFVKADSSGNTVTIYPAPGETVAGTSSKVLSAQYDKAYLVYNRSTTDWILL